MENGLILFPEGGEWVPDLESELLSWPKSRYKDQGDVLAHAAIYVNKHAAGLMTDEDEMEVNKRVLAQKFRDAQAVAARRPEPVEREMSPELASFLSGD